MKKYCLNCNSYYMVLRLEHIKTKLMRQYALPQFSSFSNSPPALMKDFVKEKNSIPSAAVVRFYLDELQLTASECLDYFI